jgi:hypothetical protein
VGCYKYVNLPRENLTKIENSDRIIVTTRDAKEHDIYVIKIEGAMIHGMEYEKDKTFRVVIPTNEIVSIEVRKLDAVKTTLFGIFITVSVFSIIIIFTTDWEELTEK